MIQIFYAQYKGVSSIGRLFSEFSDAPGTIKDLSRYVPIIGQHYFSDLLDGHSNFGSRGSYYGLSYIFYLLTINFSYEVVFVMFVLSGIVVCGLSIKRWLNIVADYQKNMVYALHFSYPFVFAADRGQMHLLIGYLFALGLSFVAKTEDDAKVIARGQLALGASFSMKLFPSIVFAFFPRFWSFQKWKILASSFIGFVLVAILLSSEEFGIVKNIFGGRGLYDEPFYFEGALTLNTSLKALIFNFQSLNIALFKNILDFLFLNYFFIYLVYASVAFVFMQGKNVQSHERLLVGAIISISIAPIAAVYCQTVVAACALWSLTCDQFVSVFRRRFYVSVVLISIVPFTVPLVPDVNNHWFFQSTIVPLAQHAYVVTMCVVVTISYLSIRRNSPAIENL